jgi:hypothetical protein
MIILKYIHFFTLSGKKTLLATECGNLYYGLKGRKAKYAVEFKVSFVVLLA